MLFFIILNNIFRRPANRRRSLPPDAFGDEHIHLWKDDDSPEAHDTRYVDALFEVRTRRLLRSDFANVEPPPDAYKKVLAAIEGAEARKSARPTLRPVESAPSGFFKTLY